MLKSMTGFGRGEGETSVGKLSVECRSINHRYFDINLKIPRRLNPLEGRIKELIRSGIGRGRVDLTIKLDTSGEARVQLEVDFALAEQYYRVLQGLKERFRLDGEITLDMLTGTKDLILSKETIEDVEPLWQEIAPVLMQCLDDLDRMRRIEGEALAKDLGQRVDRIAFIFKEIQLDFSSSLPDTLDRFRERLKALLGGTELDPSRFQQEVAFWVERTDVTEETVRAESHLDQFKGLFKGQEPVGRKMDFLLQEINREANTISSKASHAGISQKVVEIKSELEKIREQVQNIE